MDQQDPDQKLIQQLPVHHRTEQGPEGMGLLLQRVDLPPLLQAPRGSRTSRSRDSHGSDHALDGAGHQEPHGRGIRRNPDDHGNELLAHGTRHLHIRIYRNRGGSHLALPPRLHQSEGEMMNKRKIICCRCPKWRTRDCYQTRAKAVKQKRVHK